jgi:hypothetical protein
MGLFSKKEEVPEIPVSPSLPELPKSKEQPEKKDLPELPSFPSGSRNENINQEMVKSAVTDLPSPEENEVHVDIPEGLHIKEESEGGSMIPPKPSVKEVSSKEPIIPSISDTHRRTLELNATTPNKPITRQVEPIFVRIDKFQSAQKNFEHIKEKVKEIESVLGKIKSVRSKEEGELSGWADDIEKIKARLSEVDSDIFDQI